MLFNVRLFNRLRRQWARERLNFDPLWAASLCLDPDQRRDLPGEVLDAVSWTVETGRVATHRLVTSLAPSRRGPPRQGYPAFRA